MFSNGFLERGRKGNRDYGITDENVTWKWKQIECILSTSIVTFETKFLLIFDNFIHVYIIIIFTTHYLLLPHSCTHIQKPFFLLLSLFFFKCNSAAIRPGVYGYHFHKRTFYSIPRSCKSFQPPIFTMFPGLCGREVPFRTEFPSHLF